MEWALSIPDLGRLNLVMEEFEQLKEQVGDYLGPITVNRLYFGQEFCDRALCHQGEIEQMVEMAHEMDREVTLLTPYLSEKRFENLERVLDRLYRLQKKSEVVVNDWGVLLMLHERYPEFEPIMGRLMVKMLRDPRIAERSLDKRQDMKAMLQTSNLSGRYMKALLEGYGVTRLELDYPPQGLNPKINQWGYSLSLYLPYAVITTGRMCMPGSWGLDPSEKFNGASEKCTKACKSTWFELKDKSRQNYKGKSGEVLQKGNTLFYRLRGENLGKAFQAISDCGIDRVIFQPQPL